MSLLLATPMLKLPGSSYTETGVVATGSQYLKASGAYPSNIRAALFFASYALSGTARQALSSFGGGDNNDEIFHADYNGGGDIAVRFEMSDSVGNAIIMNVAHTGSTDRLHVIISVYNDGTGLYGNISVWDETSGSWQSNSYSDVTFSSAGNLAVNTSTAPTLFRVDDELSHPFDGTVYRNAAWFSTTGGQIAASTNSTTRSNFVAGGSGTSIEDPATARTAYSAHDRPYDLEGAASNYNITGGTAGGDTALTWTATGTFA